MRILEVSNKPKFGGIGIYVQGLTEELAAQGVAVGWFYAGEYDLGFRPSITRSKTNTGVKLFSLRNSPNLHAAYRITHPNAEINSPEIHSAFIKALEEFQPELVHFHDLGGLCSSLIDAAARRSIPTVTTLNCYWFICPKNDLISNVTGAICPGPQGGRNCASCIPNAGRHMLSAKVQMLIWRLLKARLPLNFFLWLSKPLLKWHQKFSYALGRNMHRARVTQSGCAQSFQQREDYNLRLLSNTVTLNIAVTSFVKQRFVEWGVPAEKLIVQHFGTRAAEFLAPTARLVSTPLVFGYIGPLTYHKGAHVLIDAFKRLRPGVAKLIVYGNASSDYGKSMIRAAEECDNIDFRGAYNHTDLQIILDEIDIIVVPPIWYDNSPQVVFEAFSAGVPVIGSKIGGIPDFVETGVNGLLFEAGNVDDLSDCMSGLVNTPSLVDSMRKKIKPMKTMRSHVDELSVVYRELILANYNKKKWGGDSSREPITKN